MKDTLEICRAAKAAAPQLAWADGDAKNRALAEMAASLEAHSEQILAANEADLSAARGVISDVMLDRLRLSDARVRAMADGIRALISLPNPVGRILQECRRPNGLCIRKVSVPFGVIAIIYESRPNVTSDAAALAVKSGNACVLRSGKEAWRSADAIVRALQSGLTAAGFARELLALVEDTSRESANVLMRARGLIDLLIPRGGRGLIDACVSGATVPCIATGTGICHVFCDEDCEVAMALEVVENAKASRPSVCNAEEVLLVHEKLAPTLLPLLSERLGAQRIAAGLPPVSLRLDEAAQKIISGAPAGAADFDTEFLDYILAVGIVSDVDAAIAHINAHSTGHSEAILTKNTAHAEKFSRLVDSAAVYVNCSTRFTDGGEFGLGCEMGISTQKLHARGPMGLEELNTYKYNVLGNGQIR